MTGLDKIFKHDKNGGKKIRYWYIKINHINPIVQIECVLKEMCPERTFK